MLSSGIMCGTRWGGHLGERHVWNVIYPGGSTLRGGAGDTSGVVSGVCTLVGGVNCGRGGFGEYFCKFPE